MWGNVAHRSGARPAPLATDFTSTTLAEAISSALDPDTRRVAQEIGEAIRSEDGLLKGVDSFHSHLPRSNMCCDVDVSSVAVWWSRKNQLRLSAGGATVMVQQGRLRFEDLLVHRKKGHTRLSLQPAVLSSKEYHSTRHQLDPWRSTAQGCIHVASTALNGVTQLLYRPMQGLSDLTVGLNKG